jgi:starch synthase (maltosyl-transferring)
MDIDPRSGEGVFPARVELGEPFTVTAQVVIEGRTKSGATAVLRNPHGKIMMRAPMTCTNPGLDRWATMLRAGEHSDAAPFDPGFTAIRRRLGTWTVVVEGWEDVFLSWLHDARIKIRIGDDIANTLELGSQLLSRWSHSRDARLHPSDRGLLIRASHALADTSLSATERLSAADNPDLARLHREHPLRDAISPSEPQPVRVERPKSSFTAWYQFFVRSEGAHTDPATGEIIQGTLRTAVTGLDRAAREGFTVVYLPPIFPIGTTHRKGRNNALDAGPRDPGSPFGIGSKLGGHDTVDPQLGTYEDFREFTAHARRLGLEVALDFALQCSPDHPWVARHPDWFQHKPDGSIAFAENPPKKYQDIYPIDFNADMPGIEREVERVLRVWIDAGVTIFRIDNPHTKPIRFWQDVISDITRAHPDILFLAEAFTRPGMMRALSYAGFTQSHCYFPWRNSKEELEEYLAATNSHDAYYQHNTFWPTTPDILTDYVRDNGIAGHAIRAVLAATGSPSWGIYNGYELIENRQRPGTEEQIDNEKYEIKIRDWSRSAHYGIAELLTSLNAIRSAHPAFLSYHNLTILKSSDPNIIAFARHTPADLTGTGRADTVIVVVNLDGHGAHQSTIHVDAGALGLGPGPFSVREELTGRAFRWGSDNFVSLAPWADVAHILAVRG